MHNPCWRVMTCSILILILILASTVVWSAPWSDGLDIVVIVTPDGPDGLNELKPRLTHFLTLLQKGDQISIAVGDQEPLDVEDNLADWGALSKAAAQLEPGGWSLNAVLTAVKAHMEAQSRAGRRQLIVIFDSRGLDSSVGDADTTLINLRKHEWSVAGLAVGQLGALEQLTRLAVGPAYAPESSAAWERAMAEVIADARRSPRLTLDETYVPIDASCKQLTLMLNGSGPLQVTRPDGSLLAEEDEGVSWSQDQGTATVTVVSPEPGYWRALGDGWSGQGIVTSSVRLAALPTLANYPVGEAITLLAYLADGDRVLVDPGAQIRADLLGPTQEIDKIILYDDGKHGDGANRDGLYGAQLRLNIPGPYQVHYEARSGLLRRTNGAHFQIVEPDGMERRYTLSPDWIDLPNLVPGRTYQRTFTLTSHLPKTESFTFQMGDDGTDLRSFGQVVVSPSEVELGPGESRTITLSIRLEPQAPLGRYAGHLSLVPASSSQRGQIVPLRLGVVPWYMAHWRWLALSGIGIFISLFSMALSLTRPQLRGSLSSLHVGGREQITLRGHRFLLSPTSHRSSLVAVRRGSSVSVYLHVRRHDPPVLLNGRPAVGRYQLHEGDQLRLGRVIWEYRDT